MTISAPFRPPSSVPDRGTAWRTWYVWTPGGRDEADALIRDTLAPLAGEAIADGRASRWFFLRYSEGGAHVRWRVETTSSEAARLADLVAARCGLRVTPGSYEREPARYGGAEHLAAAESVFCASSALALRVLGERGAAGWRLSTAIAVVIATAQGLGLDAATTVSWLRSNAYSWRWHLEPGARDRSAMLLGHAISTGHARSAAITAHFEKPPAGEWADTVRSVSATQRDLGVARRLAVWASQLHLLLNRIGITPDEERWVEWCVAAALEVTVPSDRFFDPTLGAADRVYLAASRFLPAEMPRQAPEDGPAPEPLFDWSPFAARARSLSSPGLPPVSLADALGRRSSRRGPYGPMTDSHLGALLWESTSAPLGAGLTGRTYPSAGAQNAVRLRVLVRDVLGLPEGIYDADIDRRTLIPIAPSPSPADLAAISMWFTDGPPGPMQIDVNGLPALIAVVLDMRTIRARYGLRALRMALLEAGHVAQNLALVAAATDLQLCPVGGIYDDLAHDVLLVDGLERFLAYLLPVGGMPVGPVATRVSVAATAASPMPGSPTRSHDEPTSNDGRAQ
jgi:thiopeptide-type bacteriocin biosynthesis protein